jgi:hypothetical protein
MRYIFIAILISVFVFIPVSAPQQHATHAQGDDGAACTALTNAAMQRTRQFCNRLNRDFACYGNDAVDASARTSVIDFQFEHPGDISKVSAFESIQVSGMDERLEEWGVVLMKLRANIPQASPQAVSVMLFGSVSLENAGFAAEPVSVTLNRMFSLDLYEEPAYGSDIVYSGEVGDSLLAHEQSADGSWLYVELPDTDNQMGWVRTSGVMSEGNLTALPEYTGEAAYQPMQAVYLSDNQSGDGTCDAFPTDGMLIQTPDGIAEVTLLINEVSIELGSTAFVEISQPRQMTFSLLEGHSNVTSRGVTVDVPAGFSTTIRLDLNGRASTPPSSITPYDPAVGAFWLNGSGPITVRDDDAGDDDDDDDSGNETVVICHVPPGNLENAHTITIGADAVEAHLAHGDYPGACAVTSPQNNNSNNQNNNNQNNNNQNNNNQNNNNEDTTATDEGNSNTGQGRGQGQGQGQGQDKVKSNGK